LTFDDAPGPRFIVRFRRFVRKKGFSLEFIPESSTALAARNYIG